MNLAILVFCGAFLFGQSTSSPPEWKVQPPAVSSSRNRDFGLGTGANGTQMGPFEILSDTNGVDFKPYLKRVVEVVRQNWYLLIPESANTKKGKLAIEFAITKDGKVADMRLVASSGMVLWTVQRGEPSRLRVRFRRCRASLTGSILRCVSVASNSNSFTRARKKGVIALKARNKSVAQLIDKFVSLSAEEGYLRRLLAKSQPRVSVTSAFVR